VQDTHILALNMDENVGYSYKFVDWVLIFQTGYCGNTLASTSTLAALSDCYFVCSGSQYEYCGAGNRLEMYKLTSSTSSTSSSAVSQSVSTSTSKFFKP
jgi:hypothetical protein